MSDAAIEPPLHPQEDLEQILTGAAANVGGGSATRLLPHPERASIGPFVFFDHFGPTDIPAGASEGVAPHPHIGLSTLTWLFEGEVMHRDSLGSEQVIRPGEMNLMTAGAGIVHSERPPESARSAAQRLHGAQFWLALPEDQEAGPAAFQHFEDWRLPKYEDPGIRGVFIAGAGFGKQSPVELPSPTLLMDVQLEKDARLGVPTAVERAVYVVEGRVRASGRELAAGTLAVIRQGRMPLLRALEDSRLMILGGDPVGPRTLWWNFVASDPARIEAAHQRWEQEDFPPVPGDSGRLTAPDRPS